MMRMLEGVTVPEYFVTHVGLVENLPGCRRFWVCTQERDILIPVYRAVWPIACLLQKEQMFKLLGEDHEARAH